jgi:hypothetical protein
MRLQSAALTDDAVLEMRHAAGLADPRLLELDSLRELVEQPASTSEQDVDHVDPDLVHESGREELLVEVRPHQPDPLFAGGLLRLCEGALDPVGDGEERIRGLQLPMGDDEARDVTERALAAPRLDRVVVRAAAMITAPVSCMRSPKTSSNTEGSSNAQLWSRIPSSPSPCSGVSFGAAMKPSSDMLMSITTLPMSPPLFRLPRPR